MKKEIPDSFCELILLFLEGKKEHIAHLSLSKNIKKKDKDQKLSEIKKEVIDLLDTSSKINIKIEEILNYIEKVKKK